jgi:glucose-1-phosphate thymidylyltransferase
MSVIHTTSADAIAFVREVDDPRRFGVVEVNAQGRVTRFIEKPDNMDLKNAVIGLYYLRDAGAMIRAIETQMARKQMTKGEFYLADAFQIMIEEGADFRAQPVDVWLDCGKPETVLATNRYLLEHGYDNSDQVSQKDVSIIPPVYIHPDAHLEHAIIGPNVTVSADCDISYSIIRNTIIDPGAHVHRVILDDSLIGGEAQVMGRYFTLNVGDSSSVDFT